jgi:DNA-directed RNA polymerase subunit RPC12/RpoP
MRYKCHICGIELYDIEQFANHKKQHQESAPGTSGASNTSSVTCLGCGKPIPINASQANYSGPLTCPICHGITKVVLENGQVVTARFG